MVVIIVRVPLTLDIETVVVVALEQQVVKVFRQNQVMVEWDLLFLTHFLVLRLQVMVRLVL